MRLRQKQNFAIWSAGIIGIWISTVIISNAGELSASEKKAESLYQRSCAGCHGTSGAGDGIAAPYLFPRPRDFTLNQFKFGGSQSELEKTVSRGIPGTSMPSFSKVYSPEELAEIVHFVRKRAGQTEEATPWKAPTVPNGMSSVSRGKKHFETNCGSCHGPEGRGDGPTARMMTDASGHPIRPRDLTNGPLKGGERSEDIYLRIVKGIPGTPMPAYEGLYADDVLWDMVAYVQSIRDKTASSLPSSTIPVRKLDTVPMAGDKIMWDRVPESHLSFFPLWQRPTPPPEVTVRTVMDRNEVFFRFEWVDSTRDQPSGKTSDFPDAFAVMVPTEPGIPPFLGMGQSELTGTENETVLIWYWRAASSAPSPSMAYPNTYRDSNPWEKMLFARPSEAAGNLLALRTESNATSERVFTFSARGLGTLTPVQLANLHLTPKSSWKDGRWTLSLHAEGPSYLMNSLHDAHKSWISFAIWDGSAGDRNGQKSITTWIPMEVEP